MIEFQKNNKDKIDYVSGLISKPKFKIPQPNKDIESINLKQSKESSLYSLDFAQYPNLN